MYKLYITILYRIIYNILKYNILMHCVDCVKRDVCYYIFSFLYN